MDEAYQVNASGGQAPKFQKAEVIEVVEGRNPAHPTKDRNQERGSAVEGDDAAGEAEEEGEVDPEEGLLEPWVVEGHDIKA